VATVVGRAPDEKRSGPGTPPISAETDKRICLLFPPEEHELVRTILRNEVGNNLPFRENSNAQQMEQIRFGVLKMSKGSLAKLEKIVALAKIDWRDVVIGWTANSYKRWMPHSLGRRLPAPPASRQPRLIAIIAVYCGCLIAILLVGVVMATVTAWGRRDSPFWSVPGIAIYLVAVVAFYRLALYVLGELEWWRIRRREFLIAGERTDAGTLPGRS
jgi:hypothetical protein